MTARRDLLVVDDEAVIVDAVVKICSAEGLSVDTAARGAAGLELLEKASYRLILCDIMMADMDGFQFLAELGRRGVRTPLVMATGYSTVENAVRSLSCGAVDFIPKPFTSDELLAVVRRALRYGDLRAASGDPVPGALEFVPCPPGDHRLGFVSWARLEPSGTVLLGVCDSFLKTVGGIRVISLSPAGEELVQGRSCAMIAAADGPDHPVMCPVSGRILEVNPAASMDPGAVERDPYFAGWLYRIVPSDLEFDLRRLTVCGPEGR